MGIQSRSASGRAESGAADAWPPGLGEGTVFSTLQHLPGVSLHEVRLHQPADSG